jgi:hypothetical protein
MITAFADCPNALKAFCFRWNIPNPVTRPVGVVCSVCRGMLPLALVSDVEIEANRDAQALLILELETRRWKLIERGKPVCPNCQ